MTAAAKEGAARFTVGIDLGTTHSALAWSPIAAKRRPIQAFPIEQLVEAGEHAPLPLLPSLVYLPAEGELAAHATRLPWGEPPYVVGAWAASLGAKVPGRLVASAKSWLSHGGVDRHADILPWGAEGLTRISPVEASARVLAHLRSAWDAAHPEAPLHQQDVVLTLPASFDEVARELTVQAARAAGLERFRLLEEPQAAFYDFLAQHQDALAAALGEARLALVVDVGGGTTDLTLLRIQPAEEGPPQIERIAVGDHLMLGGDNMDVTLARHVEARLGARLDAAQWSQLVRACKQAKEALLAADPPASYGISVVGRGARLLGSALRHELSGEEARRILLDGFFPLSRPEEGPVRPSRSAFAELGLPYASDPAVSRHIAAFLRKHAEAAVQAGAEVREGLARPDAILLSGGVFNAPQVVERLSQVFAHWFGESIPYLRHGSLDLAVARGACGYAQSRLGQGLRIAGGSPRAYYVGVAGEGGIPRALCVVPRGMEEGSSQAIRDRDFQLLIGKPVRFPLYSSTARRTDAAGALVGVEGLDELPPLHTVLGGVHGEAQAGMVPVQLHAALTELGTLELFLESSTPPKRRWRLEFLLRGDVGGGAEVAPIAELPARFEEARALVERIYGKKAQPVEPREVKKLWRSLEQVIGERERWSSAVNRELWGVVFGGAKRRRRSADHERIFFQLAGYCLRPGYGAPLDEWRVGELWKLFEQGVQYVNEKANWSEWWILWRRVAGGLEAGQQRRLFQWVRPWLEPPKGRFPPKPKGPRAEGFEEMVRMLAALERLRPEEKEEAGRWILHRLQDGKGSWWPIGRLGARQPLYGSLHDVVPPAVAEAWAEKLLALDLKRAEGAAFALAQIARRTHDRARDLPDALRERIARRLREAAAAESWVRLVEEGGELSEQDRARVFGESLPVGLQVG